MASTAPSTIVQVVLFVALVVGSFFAFAYIGQGVGYFAAFVLLLGYAIWMSTRQLPSNPDEPAPPGN